MKGYLPVILISFHFMSYTPPSFFITCRFCNDVFLQASDVLSSLLIEDVNRLSEDGLQILS